MGLVMVDCRAKSEESSRTHGLRSMWRRCCGAAVNLQNCTTSVCIVRLCELSKHLNGRAMLLNYLMRGYNELSRWSG